jgi:hypothetical protein
VISGQDSTSTATLAATATVVKPNDDVVGEAIAYGNSGIYFSAQWRPNSPADDSEALAGEFAAPLTNGAAPLWMKQWPDGDTYFSTTGCLNGPVTGNGYDTFESVVVGADGVYFGGESYNQTADGVGCKEPKEIVAKFNLDGAPGVFDAAGAVALRRQRFGTTYGYDGYENFDALTSNVESGTTYIYGAGSNQINCGNGSGIRKYDTSGNQIWQYADCASGGGYNALAVIGSNVYASYSAGGVPTIRQFPAAGSGPTATFSGTVDASYNGGAYTSLAVLNGKLYAAGYYYTSTEKQVYLLDGWDTGGTRLFHQVWSSDATKANGQQLNAVVAVGQRLFAVGWTRDTDNPSAAHNMGGSTTPIFPDSASYHGYGDGVIFEINPSDGSVLSATGYGTGDGKDEAFQGAATDGTDLYVIGGERDAGGQFYHAILLSYTLGAAPVTTTTTTVVSSANPSSYGQPITLTATVSGSGGTPTGSVRFDSDGNTLCAASTLVGGVATCATSALSAGSHAITATYGGDSNFNGSAGTLTQAVSKATPVINWDTPAAITYGVALSAAQLDATATHPADSGPLSGAPVPGTFAYTPAAGTVLPVGNDTLSVTFTPADAAAYTAANGAVVQRVNYGVCVLYDQTKASKSGSTVPIKLELCNAAGVNQSSPSVVVTAVGVRFASANAWGNVRDAGSANPDMNFRYTMFDPNTGGYVFNLQTKGLAPGVYQLGFTVGGDPTVYVVQFQVK